MSTVRHLPETFGFKPGAEAFPLMLPLSFSMATCNARCPICPYVNNPSLSSRYRKVRFMPPALFERIADEAGPHQAILRLSGRESTMHPDLVDCVWYAKQKGAGVGLITNGFLLSHPMSAYLLESGIDSIEISVDAADAETYSQIRVGLDFDTVLRNVRQLVALRDKARAPTVIIVSVVDQQLNTSKIESIRAFWSEIVDNVQVRKYLTWGFLNPDQGGERSPYLDDDTPCPFPFERLNIDPLGDISLCGYDIGFDVVLGNVYTQSIASVWHGEKLSQIRELMLERRWAELPLCHTCTDRRYRSWEYNIYKVWEEARENRQHR